MNRLPRTLLVRAAMLPLAVLLHACAVTGPWQLRQEAEGVQVYLQEYPGSAIPEFRGTLRIRSTIDKVMMVLTDFSRYPDWAYGCSAASVVRLEGFTEAWVYQVFTLPLVRDRDLLVHGITSRDPAGDGMWIRLEAAPAYCGDKDSAVCRAANESGLVRITESSGSFHLQQVDRDWVQVTWQQHLDPGGAIPAWATRLLIEDVPVRSLSGLRTLVEGPVPR